MNLFCGSHYIRREAGNEFVSISVDFVLDTRGETPEDVAEFLKQLDILLAQGNVNIIEADDE